MRTTRRTLGKHLGEHLSEQLANILANISEIKGVNNPTLTEFCFSMIGRADIEGSKKQRRYERLAATGQLFLSLI